MTLLVDLPGGHAYAPLFLAQTGTPAPAPTPLPADAQPSAWGSFVPLLMIVGVFFLFMAPQMKRNKEQQKLLASLKPGDDVV
ncbi:MAG TPA: preprotein translocase subunit YajC, partial [Opitutales bacterium]|nr:preprotein translocase subunit YajC [Opitutales bacterium]